MKEGKRNASVSCATLPFRANAEGAARLFCANACVACRAVSALNANSCIVADGEHNLWVLQQALPKAGAGGPEEGASFSSLGVGDLGDEESSPQSSASNAHLGQTASTNRSQSEQQLSPSEQRPLLPPPQDTQQRPNDDQVASDALHTLRSSISDSFWFRLSPVASFRCGATINKFIRGAIYETYEEGALQARRGEQLLKLEGPDGPLGASGDTASSALATSHRAASRLCNEQATRTWVASNGSVGVLLKLRDPGVFARLCYLDDAISHVIDSSPGR